MYLQALDVMRYEIQVGKDIEYSYQDDKMSKYLMMLEKQDRGAIK
jgi:hypothetical protein